MITAVFTDNSDYARATGLWQWDYGQRLRIEGLKLPTAVEIHFALTEQSGDAIPRVGTTKDSVTEVVIPDSMLENQAAGATYEIYAWIYLVDKTSGETIKRISMQVKCRPKPEAFEAPGDAELFRDAIEAVNASADRAEAAREGAEAAQKAAEEAAGKIEGEITGAGQIAEQVRQDAEAVAKDKQAVSQMVTETTQNAKKAAESAQAAERSSTAAKEAQAAAESAEAGAEAAMEEVERDRTEVSETHRLVEQMRDAVDTGRQAVAADRRAVENTALQFRQFAQSAINAVGQAQEAAVGAVSAEGQRQATAVQRAGTQAVSDVTAAKTEAVQAVTTEGDTQTKRVQDAATGIVADREQIKKNTESVTTLKEDLSEMFVLENLLSPQNGKVGGFYGVGGDGYWSKNDSFATIFISVKENTKYCYTNSNSSYVYFFTDKIDEFGRYKSLIGTSGIILGNTKFVQGNKVVEIQTPSNCKYCAINIGTALFNSNDTIMFVECEVNDFPQNFIPNAKELSPTLQKLMRFEYSPMLEKTKNLFSTSLGKLGGRYIDGSGAWQNNGYYATVYIPVKENSEYTYLQKTESTVLFLSTLNENIKYKSIEDTSIILDVHNAKNGINTFTTPSQCKYVALSYTQPDFVDGEIMFIDGNEYPNDFIEYGYDISSKITLQRVKDDVKKIIEKKIPSTKTNIMLLGDSITALCGKPTQDNSAWYKQTRGWVKYFNDVIPINLIDNTAVAGNTLLGEKSLKAQVDIILGKEYDTVPELVIIFIGTNDILDSRVNTPISYDSISNGYYNSGNELINIDTVSVDTFIGAFRYATEKLSNKFPQAKIVWCAPIAANENIRKRTTMITIVENFNKITEFAGIGYIRTDKCGICGWRENKNSNGNDLIDGIHPNENGASKLGKFIAHEVTKYL